MAYGISPVLAFPPTLPHPPLPSYVPFMPPPYNLTSTLPQPTPIYPHSQHSKPPVLQPMIPPTHPHQRSHPAFISPTYVAQPHPAPPTYMSQPYMPPQQLAPSMPIMPAHSPVPMPQPLAYIPTITPTKHRLYSQPLHPMPSYMSPSYYPSIRPQQRAHFQTPHWYTPMHNTYSSQRWFTPWYMIPPTSMPLSSATPNRQQFVQAPMLLYQYSPHVEYSAAMALPQMYPQNRALLQPIVQQHWHQQPFATGLRL